MRTCKEKSCQVKHYAKGWCRKHYRRFTGQFKKEWQRVKADKKRLKSKNKRFKKWYEKVKNTEEYKKKQREKQRKHYKKSDKRKKYLKEWKKKQPREKKRKWYRRDSHKRDFGGLRELAIKRDKEKCVWCGLSRHKHRIKYKTDLHVDHINNKGRNMPKEKKDNRLENLQTLCKACHMKKTIGL